MNHPIPIIQKQEMPAIEVWFDNLKFKPIKFRLYQENSSSSVKIELILKEFELFYFSKYPDNFGLIMCLEQIKKLKGKKKKKQLNKTAYFFEGGFKRINQLKKTSIINFEKDPFQIFTVNGKKVKIICYESLFYNYQLPEYRIVGEFL